MLSAGWTKQLCLLTSLTLKITLSWSVWTGGEDHREEWSLDMGNTPLYGTVIQKCHLSQYMNSTVLCLFPCKEKLLSEEKGIRSDSTSLSPPWCWHHQGMGFASSNLARWTSLSAAAVLQTPAGNGKRLPSACLLWGDFLFLSLVGFFWCFSHCFLRRS